MTFAEAAARLAGMAGAVLGWSPDRFWRATPAELPGPGRGGGRTRSAVRAGRAGGEGKLSLGEAAALIWHCLRDVPEGLSREKLGEALVELGLAALAPVLRQLLRQILGGR